MYNFLKRNKVKLVYLPLVVYWIIIFILTSLPGKTFADTFVLEDKLKHLIAYTVLTVLLSLTLHFQHKLRKLSEKYVFFTSAFVLLYSTGDELHQIFIPGRSASIWDWTANLIGLIIGLIITQKFIIKNNNKMKLN